MMPEKKPDENLEEWMTTYADMVTLLLCFFVMLLGASKVDVVMFEQIRSGISKDISSQQAEQPITLLVADLKDDLESLDLGEESFLANDHIGVVLELNARMLFDSGSALLKQEAMPIIKKLVSTLSAPRYSLFRFEIQGHTDDVPINTPQFPSNWELSASRAAAVVRFMIAEGISPVKFRATGMADIQPRYANRDADGGSIPHNQERNRRVVLRIDPLHK